MINLRLIYDHENYLNDVQDIPRAFSPYINICEDAEHYLKWNYVYSDGKFTLKTESDLWQDKTFTTYVDDANIIEYKKITKMFIKNSLYEYLSEVLQIKLPYGSLTGVRPTKLYYELSKKMEYSKQYLVEKYGVSQEKADLIESCVINQKGYINTDSDEVGLFLNIPFCPSRCSYCSFISTEVWRVKKELPEYVKCVNEELETTLRILLEHKFKVRSVYVGGGTPTSIGCELLEKIISPLSRFGVEFTVEAGRPETITEEILDVFKRNNVTRISINPQTFSDITLKKIGRNHTVEDIYKCFSLVKGRGFSVNADLIAGLPGEKLEDFVFSVNNILDLSPDNITIHTLALKRGSDFATSGMSKKEFGTVAEMVEFGHKSMKTAGYVPYYMYRQKNMEDNLENTGYTKQGKQCVYNIDMMEESCSVIASGAGGMSKKTDGNVISRLSNPKGFREYCTRIESICDAKYRFFTQK